MRVPGRVADGVDDVITNYVFIITASAAYHRAELWLLEERCLERNGRTEPTSTELGLVG